MASIQLSLIAERWMDEVVLFGSKADLDGDQDDDWILPAGLGDVAFMEGWMRVATFATLIANPELLGASARIVSLGGAAAVVDIIGLQRFTRFHSQIVGTYWSPDPLVVWRQGESLRLTFPELDSNAVPTADLQVYFKCVRVKPVASAGAPIRLVR